MADFAYNNAKKVSIDHTPFELYYGYYPHISFENNADSHTRSHLVEELIKDLRDLMSICL